uniref:Multiple C2 and transmembrane domain-containing protein 2 n=1 Tax=Cairina moschata TaxID=8855 RepID=A0A8C3CI53_CAIMO
MDLDKPSVWGSLKQRTRPFLQNLSTRKTKKRSSKMVVSKVRSLDRRLSVSVPDMLEVETITEEETTYSSTQVLSGDSPSNLPRPMVSLKSRNASVRPVGGDWPWPRQSTARTEGDVACLDARVAGGPTPEGKRPSSDDLLELLQRAQLKGSDCLNDLPSPFAYLLTIHLKEGRNLVIRDRCGTSDPYVKFKLNGKTLYKSKVVYKNLNPVWDETVVLPVQTLDQKLWIKVYDRDLTSSDFMGSAFVALTELELNRWSNRKKRSSSKSSFMRSMRLSDSLRKNQLWNGLVTITLLEGKNIPGGGLAEVFILLKLGDQRYKSKTLCKSANPQWREQFDFHYFSDRKDMLDIEVWRKDNKKHEELLGTCKVDITALPIKQTNCLELPLEKHPGSLLMLIAVAPCTGVVLPSQPLLVLQIYCIKNSFRDIKDVGFLQVKVLKAVDLLAADFAGKSDPFCVLELGNDSLQTHTVYKNLNPEWNKVFTFPIKDIHDVLEVTVFDEDGDKPPDFLGKVAIPLLSIRNGKQSCYTLKNKDLERASKGVIYLELDVLFNPVKASIRTFKPREKRFTEENCKFSKKILSRNVDRVKKITMAIWNTIQFLQSCFLWESTVKSMIAFVVFVVTVWSVELYMVPLALLVLFAYNFSLVRTGKVNNTQDAQDLMGLDEDDDEDDKESEKKGLIERIQMVQKVIIAVQSILEEIASFGERIKNTFNWTVPFLSVLACLVLAAATVILYFIPLRYIILIWGINKFTKKLRNPYAIDNNELLDFLSRVPSDVQKVRNEWPAPTEAASSIESGWVLCLGNTMPLHF